VIFGKLVWGKRTHHEVHEDTQKVAAFDEYLASHEPIGEGRGEGSADERLDPKPRRGRPYSRQVWRRTRSQFSWASWRRAASS